MTVDDDNLLDTIHAPRRLRKSVISKRLSLLRWELNRAKSVLLRLTFAADHWDLHGVEWELD